MPLLYKRSQKTVWDTGDSLGCLLVHNTMIKVDGKLQQTNSGRAANGPDPLGMNDWATWPGKEPWPAKAFVKGKRNMRCVINFTSIKSWISTSMDQGQLYL